MEESQKRPINNPDNSPISPSVPGTIRTNSVRSGHVKETGNNNDDLPTKNNLRSSIGRHHRDQSIRRSQGATWTKRTSYRNVPNVESSEKKLWRFFKWLPGLRVLRFPRGSTVPEDRVLEESGNPREELSMTMWNIDENEQPPAQNIRGCFRDPRSLRRLIFFFFRRFLRIIRVDDATPLLNDLEMTAPHDRGEALKAKRLEFEDLFRNGED